MSTVLLSTSYFGPVQWYQKLNRFDDVLIEQHEHFLKQTYRNRCLIATTQGTQALSLPVEAAEGGQALSKTEIKDVRISNHGKWRTEHWNALQSAYGESPFFEFYEDDIRPFFEQRWDFLFDFNLAITEKLCELLDIHPHIGKQQSMFRLCRNIQKISGVSSIPNTHRQIPTSIRVPIIKYIKRSLVFSPTSPFLICSSIWVMRAYYSFSVYQTV